MGILLLILLSIFGLFLSKISYLAFKNNVIGFILTFAFIYILSGFVTYTPDWEGYETWIKYDSGRDLFFNYLVNKISPNGYKLIHLIFTGIYSLFLIYFISRFSKETLLIVLLYLPIIYLFYTTQIRFFMGYYAMCLALYFWFVNNNKKIATIFAVFAFASHISLLIFIPLLYFFKFKINTLHKKVIWFLVIFTVSFYSIINLFQLVFPQGSRFIGYFLSTQHDSSILGGLFSFIPAIIGIYLIYRYSIKKIKHCEDLSSDKNFQFLYRLSIIPVIFVGLALNRQIIGQRFIIPALLFQLLLIFYIARHYNTKKENFNLAGLTLIYSLFYVTYVYILSPIVIGTDITQKVTLMLNSNSLIGHWF